MLTDPFILPYLMTFTVDITKVVKVPKFVYLQHTTGFMGFQGDAGGKEPTCQCRRQKRCWFDPLVGKIPWRRAWQHTPVLLPEESPWTEGPGGIQTIGLQKVGHDLSNLAHKHAWAFIHSPKLYSC